MRPPPRTAQPPVGMGSAATSATRPSGGPRSVGTSPHLLLELLSLLHLAGVAVDEETLGHVGFGHHGVPQHVQHRVLGTGHGDVVGPLAHPVRMATGGGTATAAGTRRLTRGTSSPFSMMACSFLPRSEPELTSARSRSPVERWVYPYFCTIFSHCVPFPEPGPPASGDNAPAHSRELEGTPEKRRRATAVPRARREGGRGPQAQHQMDGESCPWCGLGGVGAWGGTGCWCG